MLRNEVNPEKVIYIGRHKISRACTTNGSARGFSLRSNHDLTLFVSFYLIAFLFGELHIRPIADESFFDTAYGVF